MNIPEDITRTADVSWNGDIAHGSGTVSTQSGTVSAPYSFGTRFHHDAGTNPEELLGAALAACFTMALTAQLTRAGHPPSHIATTATVHLHTVSAGPTITGIDMKTDATVAGGIGGGPSVEPAAALSEAQFQTIAAEAKTSCPISVALQAVPIRLVATLRH